MGESIGDNALLRGDGEPWSLAIGTGSWQQPLDTVGDALTGMARVASSGYHACAVHGATGEVSCWLTATFSSNVHGELGNGYSGALGTFLARPVVDSTGTPLQGMARVAAGEYIGCAVGADRSLWCWGDNQFGMLGNGAATSDILNHAVRVKGDASNDFINVVDVVVGRYNVCAMKSDYSVYCWGNDYLTLGIGDQNPYYYPTQVTALGNSARKLVVGSAARQTCAITVEGYARCWGAGEFGDGAGAEGRALPTYAKLEGGAKLADVTAIAMGPHYACAAPNDNSLWCWGGGGLNYAWATEMEAGGQPINDVWKLGQWSGLPLYVSTGGQIRYPISFANPANWQTAAEGPCQ